MPHLLIGLGAVVGFILWLVLPSRGRAAPSHQHSHGGGGWLVVAGLFALAVAVWKNPGKIHQVAAKPPPPQVVKVTSTVTRYVPVPAHDGHPLLAGWGLVAAIGIGGAVVVCVAALVVHGARSFS